MLGAGNLDIYEAHLFLRHLTMEKTSESSKYIIIKINVKYALAKSLTQTQDVWEGFIRRSEVRGRSGSWEVLGRVC